MERKIGEIFEYNGEWYQCVEELSWGVHCNGCDFLGRICSKLNPKCSPAHHRSDGKSVIFKKLEKVGEPYTHYCPSGRIIYFQRYKLFYKLYSHNTEYIMCDFNEDGIVSIEIKQNKEDMEEKKQKLGDLVGLYSSGKITHKEFEKGIRELYEKIGKNLKEFDLQKAKDGKPVYTRDGRKARIICFDLQSIEKTPIVAAVQVTDKQEVIANYYENGRQFVDGISDLDLMMLSEKKEGWVNIYKSDNDKFSAILGSAYSYKSKEEAIDNADPDTTIATVKIEWEE